MTFGHFKTYMKQRETENVHTGKAVIAIENMCYSSLIHHFISCSVQNVLLTDTWTNLLIISTPLQTLSPS